MQNLYNPKKILTDAIRVIPNFPKEGVSFKDITTILNNKVAFQVLMEQLYQQFKNENIDYVVGLDARGFIFGGGLAHMLGAGFIPVRKKGKLPSETISVSYTLEYGEAELEMHIDAFNNETQPRVLLIDDILATGGTAAAAIELIKKTGGHLVGSCFIMEIPELGGRKKIESSAPVYCIIE
jgi:adenine phosphoribosyltransferase